MVTLHDDVEQGTPEWHEARAKKYTGSNAYKLLNSFGAGSHAFAMDSGFKGNFYTERGHLLEDEAIKIYEAITKVPVKKTGYITNDNFPSCLYSPDGFTETHLIEVKCFTEAPHLAIFNAADWLSIPLKITAQIHFGMMITEIRKARLVIYNPRLDTAHAFKWFDIDYNPTIEKRFSDILGGEYATA